MKKIFFFLLLAVGVYAQSCQNKLFTVTIQDRISVRDAIENIAKTCDLTVFVKDSGAAAKMKKDLYYVHLQNASLKKFLDTILKGNDLHYRLKGNELEISYLMTRSFKVHYVAGQRKGSSSANVQVAGSSSHLAQDGANGGSRGSTITIESSQEFQFWSTIKEEIKRILNTIGDGAVHVTKVGDSWIGPDGQKWEYNPLEPIVNPEAGMITVTGTAKQLERVAKYIESLAKQIKTEVLIDVKIMDVRINNSKSFGIDWNKIYNTSIQFDAGFRGGHGDSPYRGGDYFSATFSGDLTGVMKFLQSQGDVTVVSSPRVMTLNNQPAMISVGKEIYYRLTTTNTVGGQDTATSENQTIESVFAGVLLDITPEVDERGIVTLKVNPSITTVEEEDQENGIVGGIRVMPPDIKRRQIAAVIKVRDGQHAVLGGLITKSKGTTTDKVPLLGDIPILGYAFRNDQKIDLVDELVIIITPHIIRHNKTVSLRDLGYKTMR